MDQDNTLAKANETLDQRIAAREAHLAKLEAQRAQLAKLAIEEEAFVQRLRTFVQEAETERVRLHREFQRLRIRQQPDLDQATLNEQPHT